MRVAITGASGFLGLTLTLSAQQQEHKTLALCGQHRIAVPGVRSAHVELLHKGGVEASLEQFRPEWIAHCAAATNVDWCEEHPTQARALNAEVSRRLAVLAGRLGARLLYVSTDAVFDGARGNYLETDRCEPVNVYAATKLAGENAVLESLPSALVLRTNMVGWKQAGSPSLAEWVLEQLAADRTVPGFTDVLFSPLLVNDLGGIMLEMMQRQLSGIYHAGSASPCSKFDFARLLARAFGFSEELVARTRVNQAALKARRPLNTSLHVGKLAAALGHSLPEVAEAVERLRALQDSGFPAYLRQLRQGANYARI